MRLEVCAGMQRHGGPWLPQYMSRRFGILLICFVPMQSTSLLVTSMKESMAVRIDTCGRQGGQMLLAPVLSVRLGDGHFWGLLGYGGHMTTYSFGQSSWRFILVRL